MASTDFEVSRDGIRSGIFFFLFLIATGLSVSAGLALGALTGLILGVMMISALSAILAWAYRATSPRLRRGKIEAGDQACPACTSLQTDHVNEVQPDGRDALHWQCFACDHRWQ
jgi:hypothetical protein